MAPRNPLIEDNIKVLRQGAELIEKIGDCLYANASPPFMKSGVGSHFRHCIDFYTCFLSSVETGRVNYLLRKRNRMVEANGSLAILEIEAMIEKAPPLIADRLRRQVEVVLEESAGHLDSSGWSRSSVMRELQNLLSHTVHHYALIALALRLQGFEPGEEFGVAPSTLAYWRQTA